MHLGSLLEKLTNRRLYFDYNATSPLSPAVKRWLSEAEFLCANPSAIHLSGKKAAAVLREDSEKILKVFGLSESHKVFFHSGASEGINTIVKGMSHSLDLKGEKLNFFYSSIDHAAVLELKPFLDFYGHNAHQCSVDKDGHLDLNFLESKVKSCLPGTVLINLTYVHNEIGTVFPLEKLIKLKSETGAFIHVDCVQSPGKVHDWDCLPSGIEFYTFSSHKFGALKGIGFTFVNKTSPTFQPLINGGGQQLGFRSGTINTMGIRSTLLALGDLKERYDYSEAKAGINFLRERIREKLEGCGQIIADNSRYKNTNTIFFTVEGKDSNSLLMAFDLAGMDVGVGSACSSGISKPNNVLLNLGHTKEEALSGLRLSFEHELTTSKAALYWGKIEAVLDKVLLSSKSI
mgnify:CR=1 FL=1